MSLKIKKDLYHEKSEFQVFFYFYFYQDIRIFDSVSFGRVLTLDDCYQVTERDEFAYQEMITHIPLFSHPNPKSVLVVGAGDGGVIRELCKHKSLENIVQCELDKQVIEVCKKYFPNHIKGAYDDPRVHVLYQDAAKYVKEHSNEFDVIIVDSSDPVGPAETLYTKEFYSNCQKALTCNGILCTQGECIWNHMDLIKRCFVNCGEVFNAVTYAFVTIPTYPSGQIGFMLCSNNPNISNFYHPREVPADVLETLRYYDHDVHVASFVLPRFVKTHLGDVFYIYFSYYIKYILQKVIIIH